MSKVDSKSLPAQIRALHIAVLDHAMKAVTCAYECGKLLITASRMVPHGGFNEWVEQNTPMKRTTAWRYMKLAERIGPKLSKLDQGRELIELYRELGIVKELNTGYSKDRYEAGKGQMELPFNFDQFISVTNAFKSADISDLEASSVQQIEKQAKAVLQRCEEFRVKHAKKINAITEGKEA